MFEIINKVIIIYFIKKYFNILMIKQLMFLMVFLLLLCITFFKKGETFNEIIQLSGDFYIPDKENIIDFRQKSINSHKICIYDDSDPENVDLECINAHTLLTSLKLPFQRKTEVCIDDVCINKKDIEVLNGNRDFKLQSKDTSEYVFYNKCAYQDAITSNLCGSSHTPNINTLLPTDCDNNFPINFVLESGNNKHINAVRNDLKPGKNVSKIKEQELSHH